MKALKFLVVMGASLLLTACGHYMKQNVPTIHFSSGSAVICKECGETLDKVAADIKKRGYLNYHVRLAGYTDSAGNPKANEKLAMARANAVKKALVERGVIASRISVKTYGERDQLVDTRDGTKEVKNRRVEILMENPTLWDR